MDSHLITIEVRVESGSDERMQLDRRAFDQERFKCLDAQAVQRRRTIQQNGTFADHTFQRFPNFWTVTLDQTTSAFYVSGIIILHETRDHKRTIQLKSHALGKSALIKFQLRAHYDHRTTGIVHTLAKQVAAEAT